MLSSFVAVIDTREQSPFTFQDLRGDAGRQVLTVPCLRRALPSGDYSIDGHEDHIAIERKSLEDLFGSLGRERARFKREIERLARMNYAAVVCEADWDCIMRFPPEFSRLPPRTVYRTVLAWQLAYPSVHWWMCPGRRFAEITTYRLLERYWTWWTIHHERWGIPPAKPTLDGAGLGSIS